MTLANNNLLLIIIIFNITNPQASMMHLLETILISPDTEYFVLTLAKVEIYHSHHIVILMIMINV